MSIYAVDEQRIGKAIDGIRMVTPKDAKEVDIAIDKARFVMGAAKVCHVRSIFQEYAGFRRATALIKEGMEHLYGENTPAIKQVNNATTELDFALLDEVIGELMNTCGCKPT